MRRQAKLDLSGRKYGLQTVIEPHDDLRAYSGAPTQFKWLVRCDCGTQRVVSYTALYRGRGCGCIQRKRAVQANTKHGKLVGRRGLGGARTYRIWQNMLNRCRNEKLAAYQNYGGRGISVCERWRNSFAAFVEDMGEAPPDRSIDRINNDGNYEPGNCRWATRKEQNANQRPKKSKRASASHHNREEVHANS